MSDLLATLAIGFGSGLLSGAFGIGGGVVTTPAIRLVLGRSALIAVGTPLPVIFPSALTGAYNYARSGSADVRGGVTLGLAGSLFAVAGAWGTRVVGGDTVLVATAVLILYSAADMLLQVFRPSATVADAASAGCSEDSAAGADAEGVRAPGEDPERKPAEAALARLLAIGALAGTYSGFFGLGGGFVVVPMLTRFCRFDVKRAIGTSLIAISILAVPGTITHALLGHIDWRIASGLAAGVIPGAAIGARFTLAADDRWVRLGFATLLVATGVWLAGNEIAGWLR